MPIKGLRSGRSPGHSPPLFRSFHRQRVPLDLCTVTIILRRVRVQCATSGKQMARSFYGLYAAILIYGISVSVCLSDQCQCFVEKIKYVVKLFPTSGSTNTAVFWAQPPLQSSEGTPSVGALNTRGRNRLRFRQKNCLSWTLQDKPMVTMDH